MVKEAIATGATVEEAHANACAQLGVDTAEAEFEILELPEKKRFGLFGGSPAKVRAFIRETPADVAAAYLRSVLGAMGLADVEIEIREVDAGAELVLHPNKAATAEQRAAARAALLALTGSGDGSVTIVADGTKPAIDLPVSVEVLLDGRVDALESALQGDGSYTSKYSGEEIDQLLDTIAAQ